MTEFTSASKSSLFAASARSFLGPAARSGLKSILLAMSAAGLSALAACTALTAPPDHRSSESSAAAPTARKVAPAAAPNPDAKLAIVDLQVGSGAEAKAGDRISVHYTGTLENGQTFDSSRNRGQPFTFKLGAREVIAGWDQGVAGMKVGGKRKLTIPSHLAYGERGSPPVIPANATLIFEVELVSINPS